MATSKKQSHVGYLAEEYCRAVDIDYNDQHLFEIEVNDTFSLEARFTSKAFIIKSPLAPYDELANKKRTLRVLLQHLGHYLMDAKEALAITPDDRQLVVIRQIWEPQSIQELVNTTNDFINSYNFFKEAITVVMGSDE